MLVPRAIMKISSVLALGAVLVSPVLSTVDEIGHVTKGSERSIAKRSSLLSEILTDIEDLTECSACEALLVVLKVLAALGNDDFVDVIVDVCEGLVRIIVLTAPTRLGR
jgi:sphingomyelin phosphodiesterase